MLISHTWSGEPPSAEPFMLGDEANEGSGSGRSYPDDDAAYDAEGSGEGSGNDKIGTTDLLYYYILFLTAAPRLFRYSKILAMIA